MDSSNRPHRPTTSIILPCYCEKENVLDLILAIEKQLEGLSFEIVVVDDNSPDGTVAAIDGLEKPFVNAICRKADPSLGGSILDGLLAAKGENLIIMDSDFNHSPHYLPMMIENLKFYDCVCASRFQYGGKMESKRRTLLSWVYNIAIRILTGGMVTDSLYGYLAIKKDVLDRLQLCTPEIFRGYGDYCIRLMFHLQTNKVSILQFPAVNGIRKHGEGNSAFFKVFLSYSKEVLKLVWNQRIRGRKSK